MELIRIKNNVMPIKEGVAATIGQFDGLHIGHLKLFNETLSLSKIENVKSAVITFDPHPDFILCKDKNLSYITPFEKKVELISNLGFDYLFVIEFNKDIANISPLDFVTNYLVKLNVRFSVVGFDFNFGYKGQGKAKDIEKLSGSLIKNKIIEEVKIDNNKISSIDVKKSLVKGDVKNANFLLGRYYEISGIVVYGNQVGSKINVPTANILYDDSYVKLSPGAYVTLFEYNDNTYPSITNIGHNPSFNYSNKISMECHIIDFNEDIYQKEVTVKFVEKIRDEIKFNSVEEFKIQIEKDKKHALSILG